MTSEGMAEERWRPGFGWLKFPPSPDFRVVRTWCSGICPVRDIEPNFWLIRMGPESVEFTSTRGVSEGSFRETMAVAIPHW